MSEFGGSQWGNHPSFCTHLLGLTGLLRSSWFPRTYRTITSRQAILTLKPAFGRYYAACQSRQAHPGDAGFDLRNLHRCPSFEAVRLGRREQALLVSERHSHSCGPSPILQVDALLVQPEALPPEELRLLLEHLPSVVGHLSCLTLLANSATQSGCSATDLLLCVKKCYDYHYQNPLARLSRY